MTDHMAPGNDVHPARGAEADAHGQAALLLAESILHALIETRSLTLDRAIDIVRTAAELKVDLADELGESNARMLESIALLNAIERSLQVDEDIPSLS